MSRGARMRGDFADLLEETLLFAASPKPRAVPASFQVSPLAGGRPDVTNGESPAGRKIWQFELNGLDAVRDVTVRNRSMRDMRMSVCREVSWGEVKVTYQAKTVHLPLTERFLLRTHYLPDGAVPESNEGFWQLPMNLEQSFQRLFGFQLKAGQLQPLSDAELHAPGLMASSPFAFNRPGQGGHPLRVLVCMALGCAKECNDFEPGGVLGAARLIPHVMLVANLPVEGMEATVRLSRSPMTSHTRMGDEEMSANISSAFFTDRNDAVHPYPRWDNLFDYYWIDPPMGAEVRVVRTDRPSVRERDGLIKEVEMGSSRGSAWVSGYKSRRLKKVARQGEFDNIHLAPKMKLPAAVANKLPGGWPKEVTMAPFCVHDCLHLHWRWGTRNDLVPEGPKWVRGWSGDVPYRQAGAPMVPSNQDVSIKVLGPYSITYTARIRAPTVGRWQVVMHHGAAYALSYTRLPAWLPFLEDGLTPDLREESWADGRWARMYWHLRYALAPHALRSLGPTGTLAAGVKGQDRYAERLAWESGGISAARDL